VLDTKGNGEDRLEFTKKRDVIQIWNATNGYELTYKGKKELPKDIEDDYFRRLQHSIEKVVLVWLKTRRRLWSMVAQAWCSAGLRTRLR